MGRRKDGLTAAEQATLMSVLHAVADEASALEARTGQSLRKGRTGGGSGSASGGRDERIRRGGFGVSERARAQAEDGTASGGAGWERRERVRNLQTARRLPWKIALGIAVSGFFAWGMSVLLGLGDMVPSVVVGLVVAGIVLVVGLLVFLVKRKQVERRWRRRVWVAVLGGPVWVFVAGTWGVGVVLVSLLVAATGVLSAGWWRQNRVHTSGGKDLAVRPATVVVERGELEAVLREWADRVACTGGPVPKSLLTDGEMLERAMRFTLETVSGTVEFTDLLARRGKIAAALRRRMVDIQLDPHPSGRADLAKLTIITQNLLEKGVPFTGPRYENGRVPIGPFDDGEGEAYITVTDSAGCYGFAVSGEPRSGKSACFEGTGLSLRSSGVWFVPYLDGDPTGGSSPLMNEYMNWPMAGPEGAMAQLEAMEAWLELRGMQKNMLTEGPDGLPIPLTDPDTQRPARKILPCPDFPGIMWMIDELHRLTGDEGLRRWGFVERLERLVRIGPKYGLGVGTATQSLLMPDYGGSTALRAFLTAKQLIAFRNGNKTEVAVINGLSVPPYALPLGGGYAYITAGGRLAMLRARWSPNMAQYGPGLPDADLGADMRLAVQHLWTGEKPDPKQMIAKARADMMAWRARITAGGTGARRQLAAAPGNAGGSAAFGGATARILKLRASIPAPLGDADVVPAGTVGGLSGDARRLLDMVKSGRFADGDGLSKRADMMAHTGWDKNKFARVANELKEAGELESPKQGFYRPAEGATTQQSA